MSAKDDLLRLAKRIARLKEWHLRANLSDACEAATAIENDMRALATSMPEQLPAQGWVPIKTRPADGQAIIYYFEPMGGGIHIGHYDAETDSVAGRSGFTSVIPEVPYWMPLPKSPEP